MSDKIQDQISAFTDDELSAEECAFLVRRLERDPTSRAQALRYSIIGDALRGELPNPDPNVLLQRVRAELDGVEAGEQVRESPGGSRRLVRPAAGFGIAAGVAVAALALLYNVNRPIDGSDPSQLLTSTTVDAVPEEQVSYVVPQEAADSLVASDALTPHPIRLTNYLMTHGEYASGLGRTSIHTNVISNDGTTVRTTLAPAQER